MSSPSSPVISPLATHSSSLLLDPEPRHHESQHTEDDEEAEYERSSDGDTASQRSISLSSPPRSPRTSIHQPTASDSLDVAHADSSLTPVALVRQGLADANRESHTYTLDTDFSSEHDFHDDGDDRSSFMRRLDGPESPFSSVAPSLHGGNSDDDKENMVPVHQFSQITSASETRLGKKSPEAGAASVPEADNTEQELELDEGQDIVHPLPSATSRLSMSAGSRSSITSFVSPSSYPPPPRQSPDPRASIVSFASSSTTYSRKVRPESMLVTYTGPLVLGIALVDFNHLVGPKIQFSRGAIFDDEEISKILPFLALPDGAHLVSPMAVCWFSIEFTVTIDSGRLLLLPSGSVVPKPHHYFRYFVSVRLYWNGGRIDSVLLE